MARRLLFDESRIVLLSSEVREEFHNLGYISITLELLR